MNLHGTLLSLDTPKVMGILNVTPDSFFDGGRFTTTTTVLEQVKKMLSDGADIIDIGGSSTRPGAEAVSENEEAQRVLPVIESLVKTFPGIIISIDTTRASIARQAIDAGASMINDISGGDDNQMFSTVADCNVPYVLMHMRGNPQTMSTLTQYDNILKDMAFYFSQKVDQLKQAGVKDIIVDPGFGFAKTVEQNFYLLHHLDYFKILGLPILAGLSRKSTIWKTLETTPENALNGTTVLNTVALLKGARILRIHDVKEAVECIKLISKMPQTTL